METCNVSQGPILAALDLSSYSETVFLHALTLARSLKRELILLNVVNSRGRETLDLLNSQGFTVSFDQYAEGIQAERKALFGSDYLSRAQDVPTRLVFRVGLPYEEIVKALADQGASMVVMGCKGRTNLAGALFGTTAEKVFRRATCPVFSVRGPEHCRLP